MHTTQENIGRRILYIYIYTIYTIYNIYTLYIYIYILKNEL